MVKKSFLSKTTQISNRLAIKKAVNQYWALFLCSIKAQSAGGQKNN